VRLALCAKRKATLARPPGWRSTAAYLDEYSAAANRAIPASFVFLRPVFWRATEMWLDEDGTLAPGELFLDGTSPVQRGITPDDGRARGDRETAIASFGGF
jgi:hypothetical protein